MQQLELQALMQLAAVWGVVCFCCVCVCVQRASGAGQSGWWGEFGLVGWLGLGGIC
jgi:hypothetical protein